jgi:outer membrane protein insertion porin family
VSVLCTADGLYGKSRKPMPCKIKTVAFVNNRVYSDRQLRQVMVSRPPSLFASTVYRKEILADDLKSLALFYHQNGYLDARIAESSVRVDSGLGQVYISITMEEGQLTRIDGMGVLGNRVFTDETLLELIRLKAGDPFEKLRIERATLALLRFYADHGYLEADVEPEGRIDSVAHRAILDFRIQEGHQSIVGDIVLDGLEKTRPKVIFRELRFIRGDVLNYSRLL